MAQSTEKLDTDNQPSSTPNAVPVQGQPQQAQIQIDDSKVMALYANFCRVTGTPEEMSAPDVSGRVQ